MIRCNSEADSIVWMREDKHVNDKTSEKTFLLHDRTPDDGYIRGFVVFRQQNAHKMCILLYEIFRRQKHAYNPSHFPKREKETSEMDATNKTVTVKRVNVRYLTVTAMLSAVAYILMFLDFSVPFMPSFIKMDLSELPALIGSFAMGPLCGVIICLVKNVLHLFITSTGGVGELSNFILGVAFVLPAGLLYKYKKTRTTALIGSIAGAVIMGAFSIVSNYFLVYPVYYNFMPQEAVLGAYQLIAPSMKSILQCLICFNMPFTFIKGMFSVVITFVTYKHISPILKGRQS